MSPLRMFAPLVASCAIASLPAQRDWTHCQSPVKNQQNRGTCAAFAICGALETFPGMPGDLSEQLLYATLKLHQNEVVGWLQKAGHEASLREGDLFSAYVGLFDLIGTCAEPFLPYDPDPKRAGPGVPDELKRYLELAHVPPEGLERLRDGFGKYGFRARDCKVLGRDAVRDVDALKSLLDGGAVAIPVGYDVHAPSWFRLAEVGNTGADGRRLFVHPGMMHRFRREGTEWSDYNTAKLACMQSGEDFADGVANGTWEREPIGPADEYAGHAVLIVGYEERGFLAKNSWGTGWGDGGYFKITWDYHRLHAIQGLVIRAPRIRNPALNPMETSARIREGRFRIKVQPRGLGEAAHWALSTWMLEARDAAFERVEYAVSAQGADGSWRDVCTKVADAGDTQRRSGAPVTIDGADLAAASAAQSVRITVRIGVRASADTSDLQANQWLRTIELQPLSPALSGAVDLEPAN